MKEFDGMDDQGYLEDKVHKLVEGVQQLTEELGDYKKQLAAFKTDKCLYLVEYINREVFGEKWEEEKQMLRVDAHRLGKCCRLKHRNTTGVVSGRDTGPLVLEGTHMPIGYCFLRRYKRTFEVFRIEELWDLQPRSVC